ncbi:nuclear pore membrane glycoprotein 210-like, partial [Trichonephila inaurata madagascariensis]
MCKTQKGRDWGVFESGLLVLVLFSTTFAVRLNRPRILLPFNTPGLPSNYTLHVLEDENNDCYEWKSTNQHFVAVEPILDLHDCSRSALLYSLSSAPERRHDVILAK